jgi:arsenate reductase (glutaredoxin)
MIIIYVNLQCSKCRIALDLLKGKEFEVVEYLKTGLSKELVSEFYDVFGSDILREKDLVSPIEMIKENIVNAIIENPKLLQRPVLVDGERMIIGRDLEKLKEFLGFMKII